MVSQQLAKDRSVLISRVLLVPNLVEGTTWPVLLDTPALLHNDIVHSHSTQNGMDLRRRLAAKDCIHILGTIPREAGTEL